MSTAAPKPVPPVAGLRDEALRILRLAGPVMIAYLGQFSMGTVDTIMAGHLGAVALGSVALGNTWAVAVAIVAWGAARALDPVVAQAHGAGDIGAAGAGLTRGLAMALVLGGPVVALYALAPLGLGWLGQPAALLPGASSFCLALIPGIPAMLAFSMVRQFLQATGHMREATVAIVFANLMNVTLNWVLMYGRLGVPALGTVGCALSTSISQWFMLGVVVLVSRGTLAHYWPGWRGAFDPTPLRRMLRLGLTLGLQFGLEVWAFHAAGFMVGRLGAVAVASHAVAINLASVAFMLPSGVGAAAATRVGHLVGAGQRWARSGWIALLCGAAIVTIPAVLFVLMPRMLASIYTRDAAVIDLAATLLPLAGAFQVFDGTQAVAFGVLRGAGDVHVPAAANLVGYWLLGLPIGGVLAFAFHLGARGVWLGLVVALAAVAGILVARIAILGRRATERLRC